METGKITHLTSTKKVKVNIIELEAKLKNTSYPSDRSEIKDQLTKLYKIRKKQKTYIPPPKSHKPLTKGF